MGTAVDVTNVSKRYRLYHERNNSLKAAILRRQRSRFEEFWALKDVTLAIPEGSTFGLIGENGSGKSTMLKCIARIIRPDKGAISINGSVSALLELGAGFHPELTGRENVYLNGSILGMSRRDIDTRFDDIVGFAGLERFIDIPVKNYSSGMYVRLGFSVAINVEPDILLVDEVLAVGDEQFQRRCVEKFEQFRAEGRTVVVVSHALGQIRELCTHVALLEHGEMIATGTPHDVIETYLDDLSAGRRGGVSARGEGDIARIEMFDSRGRAVDRVRTGEEITFRLHYDAAAPVPHAVFGIAIDRADGLLVTGPTTRSNDLPAGVVEGSGYIDYKVPSLPLVPGTYDFGASLFDATQYHLFDRRPRTFRFHVDEGFPTEHDGVVTLGGTWEGAVVTNGLHRPFQPMIGDDTEPATPPVVPAPADAPPATPIPEPELETDPQP